MPYSACYDHKGNKYKSLTAMCRAYNISMTAFKYRHDTRKWSLEKTLETPLINTRMAYAAPCVDHLGNKFPSKRDMCDYWRIPRALFYNRMRAGWSVEKALTTPPLESKHILHVIKDHKGNIYRNVDDMCAAYNISKADYIQNIKNGLDIEHALTTKAVYDNIVRDHLGNIYTSKNEMFRKYNITKGKFRGRLELGWTLKEILETSDFRPNLEITDPYGNKFKTKKEMVEFYGISQMTYNHRIAQGLTPEEALQNKKLNLRPCHDHHGQYFKRLCDMLEWYSNLTGSYHTSMTRYNDLRKALLGTPYRKLDLPDYIKVIDILDDYYLVKFKNNEILISDIDLHKIVRQTRVDKYLTEHNNILPDNSEVNKLSEIYYFIQKQNHDIVTTADEIFKIIFFGQDN